MTDTERFVATTLIANLVALNGKIVWDWLRARNAPPPEAGAHVAGGCPLHGLVQRRSDQMEAIVQTLERSFKVHEAVAEERLGDLRRDLEKGEAVFQMIHQMLQSLTSGQSAGQLMMAEINRRLIHMEQSRSGGGNGK